MKINANLIEDLIFNRFRKSLRFTQDSPVYPDVWLEYYKATESLDTKRVDLILTPHRDSSAAVLFQELSEQLMGNKPTEDNIVYQMATNGESVVLKLTLRELISIALPLTKWWKQYLWDSEGRPTSDLRWLQELLGALHTAGNEELRERDYASDETLNVFSRESGKHYRFEHTFNQQERPVLWAVSRNRQASFTIARSVPATKADACRKLFGIDGSGITWAVLDTGIDARHGVFRKKDLKTGKPFPEPMGSKIDKFSNCTRIIETYDFTKFRLMLTEIHTLFPDSRSIRSRVATSDKNDESLSDSKIQSSVTEIMRGLKAGRLFDWSLVAPLLKVPHNKQEYRPPFHPHGTHVAGIIGAGSELQQRENPLVGMCPCIDIYDIRVMDERGEGDEFNILAALQFVRWLNNKKDGPLIHGVNLSFSIPHEVSSYACGQTPVCEACDRLVSDGTVVVDAAGNNGQTMFQSRNGMMSEGFRTVNITDPGNADLVITVGSTHRNRPHSYGVSYFSSKGPTGDGRIKPDLVAPGEKIISAALDDGEEPMDGTSMAAPHVSGAAALLMARHRELIGRPRRIKEILCKTATDLGREKYFQGCGMLDVLRAVQSV